MARVKGLAEVQRFIRGLPADLERTVLPGAARAAAKVVAGEAMERANAEEVREGIVVGRAKSESGRVVVKVSVKPGWARSLGIWAEYGTDPHFISVDDSQRQGMSVNKINQTEKMGSLVINGHFVGKTVHHPGAVAHPFLRPALDRKSVV